MLSVPTTGANPGSADPIPSGAVPSAKFWSAEVLVSNLLLAPDLDSPLNPDLDSLLSPALLSVALLSPGGPN